MDSRNNGVWKTASKSEYDKASLDDLRTRAVHLSLCDEEVELINRIISDEARFHRIRHYLSLVNSFKDQINVFPILSQAEVVAEIDKETDHGYIPFHSWMGPDGEVMHTSTKTDNESNLRYMIAQLTGKGASTKSSTDWVLDAHRLDVFKDYCATVLSVVPPDLNKLKLSELRIGMSASVEPVKEEEMKKELNTFYNDLLKSVPKTTLAAESKTFGKHRAFRMPFKDVWKDPRIPYYRNGYSTRQKWELALRGVDFGGLERKAYGHSTVNNWKDLFSNGEVTRDNVLDGCKKDAVIVSDVFFTKNEPGKQQAVLELDRDEVGDVEEHTKWKYHAQMTMDLVDRFQKSNGLILVYKVFPNIDTTTIGYDMPQLENDYFWTDLSTVAVNTVAYYGPRGHNCEKIWAIVRKDAKPRLSRSLGKAFMKPKLWDPMQEKWLIQAFTSNHWRNVSLLICNPSLYSEKFPYAFFHNAAGKANFYLPKSRFAKKLFTVYAIEDDDTAQNLLEMQKPVEAKEEAVPPHVHSDGFDEAHEQFISCADSIKPDDLNVAEDLFIDGCAVVDSDGNPASYSPGLVDWIVRFMTEHEDLDEATKCAFSKYNESVSARLLDITMGS